MYLNPKTDKIIENIMHLKLCCKGYRASRIIYSYQKLPGVTCSLGSSDRILGHRKRLMY